ncbi:DUF1080 domain-containing protein [Lewinella sp. JB7]|uniref:3-keto-disaccharide hydrolase n=1 Tax=Lewinella sp. JB7 TaxID=2962887 RepID=UPI0020CA22F5|nr:DUF1080 domain-containing protein [Lewinella sp. JB7]MCP9234687.1 DUF1080 domain-containing protein [Lewinella sp. JB7]
MRLSTILFLTATITASASAQDTTYLLTDSGLTGWQVIVQERGAVPVAEQDLFAYEGGSLHVMAHAPDGSRQPFAALVTDAEYERYHLHVEYRWGEKKFAPRTDAVRDAGVLFHVFDTGIFWPSGLECQIQEGDTGDAWLIGARATSTLHPDAHNFASSGHPETRAGERYAKFARSFSWEVPGWNTIDMEVDGATARFYVNGHLVNELTGSERPDPRSGKWVALGKGKIALQAEGAELFYRNVWLVEKSVNKQ